MAAAMRRLAALAARLFLAVALWAAAGASANGDTPLSLDGATVVDATQVADLAARGAAVIDTRALHDFLAGHLPDASHVDYKEHSARDVAFDAREDDVPAFLLRLRKFAKPGGPVVFYCNGPSCWKSYKGAAAASRAGYRQVYWFRGGLGAWLQDGRAVIRE